LTEDRIREQIAKIAQLDGDDESQHVLQDDLTEWVLRVIADAVPEEDPAALAKEVIKVYELTFSRWCA
jgi:hypothetical protein